jgi:hypothetical protein
MNISTKGGAETENCRIKFILQVWPLNDKVVCTSVHRDPNPSWITPRDLVKDSRHCDTV